MSLPFGGKDSPAPRRGQVLPGRRPGNHDQVVLIVTHEVESSVVTSARNLQRVKTMPASNLNVLDLLTYDRLVMTMEAIHKAEEVWAGGVTQQEMVTISKTPTRKKTSRKPAASKRAKKETPSAEDQPTTGPSDDEAAQEAKG